MKIEQLYTGCLAHGAYYIESNGAAAIIDPLRDVASYIRKAQQDNAVIKYVLETHFHADFVSGHLELAAATGATIVYGPEAQPGFPAHIATDGEILTLGAIKLKVLHTPGHTMESSCFLLINEAGEETALFSGDTLFIGDVGRPDLAQQASGKTKEELAGILFDSLRGKVMPLPGHITIYPAHGAGSACGKNMSDQTTDTLAHQLAINYALRKNMTREDFIKEVTEGLTPPPAYFPMNVSLNKQGYGHVEEVMNRGLRPLSPAAFEAAANETEAVILDTRGPEIFVVGFIPGSFNIGLDGNFAPWAGTLIPVVKHPILFIADPGREEEVVTRLARIGYDNTIGYLEGGFNAWKTDDRPTDTITVITPDELADRMLWTAVNILDIRRRSEYGNEHIENAINIPLESINDNTQLPDKKQLYYVHCAGGYRSAIFISIMRMRGYHNLVDIRGGLKAMKECGRFQLTDYLSTSQFL
ncbi:MBL fold metallo-hydrolase [Chitinophaga ginsengisoli]|uniref:Glyoxylase-like metal-dependent hydrolase (Beta-lactamase superfamily II) n=1 Tax=Chitinophaga ginsengisoli TaxID=363837 RepID=A0A2P8FDX0_9BACT|nr:MBL fold metallo-hydrolase [Chitinophaga ginsengisoli]PSL19922.1 glyoxylase-like metal-dependent hydrolase (beta-lactamase superfamily II) [Chitinophaga ginsengisoli]